MQSITDSNELKHRTCPQRNNTGQILGGQFYGFTSMMPTHCLTCSSSFCEGNAVITMRTMNGRLDTNNTNYIGVLLLIPKGNFNIKVT
jgi:hypothetical protein